MNDLPRQFPCDHCDKGCTSPNECPEFAAVPTDPVPIPRWRGDENKAKHKAVKPPK